MSQLTAQGVTVELPTGFEGRAIRRSQGPPAAGATALGAEPEKTLAIIHAATVPLPPEIGDFGSNVVDILGSDDVFVAVFEYDSSAANTALFGEQGIPRSLDFEAFSPTLLQRTIKGQSGAQRFFTEADRAFCLYAVLGSDARRSELMGKVNGLLATLQIESLAPVGTGPGMQPPTTTTTTTVPLSSVTDLVAAQGDLKTFTELLGTSGVRTSIAGTGPFTVFAPSDDAFAAFDLETLRADEVLMRRTLEYHVVPDLVHADASKTDSSF